MAYGSLAAIADATKNFAVDLISGQIFTRTKIAFGPENSATDVSAANPLPVTGPLTDAQLRASVVPISGTVAATGPLTNAELRAAAVDTTASTYAAVIASNIITRPANTTAYAAGEVVGVVGGGTAGRFLFAGAAARNAGAVRIDRARLYKSQATAAGTFTLWIFRGDPAAAAIANAAVAANVLPIGNAASGTQLIGRINFDMNGAAVSSLAGASGAEVAGAPIIGAGLLAQAAAGETALYGVLVATSAYTPASGETLSVVLEGYRF